MTNPYLILPLALGVSVVLQGTINRQMALEYGLGITILLNAVVFLILSLGFFLVAKYNPLVVPEFWRLREPSVGFLLRYLLPGAFGFVIVICLPWAIQNLGPSTSIILVIASQILLSIALEISQNGIAGNSAKLIGAALVLAGSWLTVRAA